MSNSTILRQLAMLKMVPKYPAFVLAKDLVVGLKAEGFETTLRTIQRDLQGLQEIFSLDPCESPEGLKWRFAQVNTELLPNMQPNEALLLVMAEEMLKQTMPSDSLRMLEPRLEKAHATLSKQNSLAKWQDKIKIIHGSLPLQISKLDEEVRATVYDAVLKEEQLSLSYKKREHEEPYHYQVNPLGIIVRDYSQYLVASKLESPEQPQLFLLNRIKEAQRLPIEIPAKLKPLFQESVEDNVSGFFLEDEQTIKLQARRAPRNILLNHKISPEQTVTEIGDGWSEITAQCAITYDLVGWICQHAQSVKVIEPESLKKQVIERLQNGLTLNS